MDGLQEDQVRRGNGEGMMERIQGDSAEIKGHFRSFTET